jgi:adenosylcobinamide-GDP ribazoletransferase
MKDSRIGTYGCIALILTLLLKFTTLLEAQGRTSTIVFILMLIAGHTLSRQLASSVIENATYVQDIDQSKVKPITDRRLSLRERWVSYSISVLPVLGVGIFSPLATLVAITASILSVWVFMRYCNQRLGGYTGDILGACQQISELSFYLAFIAGLA